MVEMSLTSIRKSAGTFIALPVVRLLARTGVSPDAISWAGFFLTVGAAYLVAVGYLLPAGIVVIVGSFLDMLDGALARHTDRVTPSGGVLDSTLDRLSEAALFLGILALYLTADKDSALFSVLGREWSVVLVFVTLMASQMVSYIRARAESAGMDCQVGVFTRAERVVVLVLGLALGLINIALGIIAVLSIITMCQRIARVARGARGGSKS